MLGIYLVGTPRQARAKDLEVGPDMSLFASLQPMPPANLVVFTTLCAIKPSIGCRQIQQSTMRSTNTGLFRGRSEPERGQRIVGRKRGRISDI